MTLLIKGTRKATLGAVGNYNYILVTKEFNLQTEKIRPVEMTHLDYRIEKTPIGFLLMGEGFILMEADSHPHNVMLELDTQFGHSIRVPSPINYPLGIHSTLINKIPKKTPPLLIRTRDITMLGKNGEVTSIGILIPTIKTLQEFCHSSRVAFFNSAALQDILARCETN